jgi:hypothetical protein
MWDPQRLTNLWASMACYRDSFTLPSTYVNLLHLIAKFRSDVIVDSFLIKKIFQKKILDTLLIISELNLVLLAAMFHCLLS